MPIELLMEHHQQMSFGLGLHLEGVQPVEDPHIHGSRYAYACVRVRASDWRVYLEDLFVVNMPSAGDLFHGCVLFPWVDFIAAYINLKRPCGIHNTGLTDFNVFCIYVIRCNSLFSQSDDTEFCFVSECKLSSVL